MHNKYNATLYNIDSNSTVINDTGWFIYNYEKQKAISNSYDFINGDSDYLIAIKDNKQVLLDYSGKELSKYYDSISIWQDNIVVKNGELEYVMNKKGDIVSKGYNKILYSNDKIIIVEEDELLGIIDCNGKSKIKEKNKNIRLSI